MCGISGFIDHHQSPEQAKQLIDAMLEKIAHRGPDARSVFVDPKVVLGHNRLSIIDLSEEGTQPMHYFDAVIVFNGEIYNYIELKKELQTKGVQFKTDSDTEVVLAAYRTYGTECVQHFVGMWAFAIWDKLTSSLFCSRDRFGIKPFNYILDEHRFYFASEYKALKEAPIFKSELNMNQVYRGLQLGWISYDEETYFKSIQSLPAACNLTYSNGTVQIEKYWDIDLHKKFRGTDEEKSARFQELFYDSVKLHMRADVEVGGCLSGGLDSSAIASAIAKMFPEVDFKTFTIFYEGKDTVDERPWVNKVIAKYPHLKNFTFSPRDEDIPEGFEKTLFHADVPIAGSSPVSQYFVMKLAKQNGLKVVLDGQGSDEYLAGYMHSFYRLFGGMMAKLKLSSFLSAFSHHGRLQNFSAKKKLQTVGVSLLSGLQSEQALYAFEYKNYFPFLPKKGEINFLLEEKGGDSRLNKFLYHLMFNTSLPSLLHYEDRNSMAFSIESRVPFLDHRLVEFVFSLNDEDKIFKGITKNILRKSLSTIMPDEIVNRTDKKGFVTPGEVRWLKGPLSYLLEEKMEIPGIKSSTVKSEIRKFKNGETKNANLVWRAAVLNHWLQKQ